MFDTYFKRNRWPTDISLDSSGLNLVVVDSGRIFEVIDGRSVIPVDSTCDGDLEEVAHAVLDAFDNIYAATNVGDVFLIDSSNRSSVVKVRQIKSDTLAA